jgi:hypothetical protein
MNQYVIYKKPKDYPTKFVVRLWIIGPGTAQAVLCEDIQQ